LISESIDSLVLAKSLFGKGQSSEYFRNSCGMSELFLQEFTVPASKKTSEIITMLMIVILVILFIKLLIAFFPFSLL